METFTQLPPPERGRTVALWLLAIVLGTSLIILYFFLNSAPAATGKPWLPTGPLMLSTALAAIFSLPTFALLPVTSSIQWALSSHNILPRHGRLLVVLSRLFGAAALVAYCFFGWLVWLFSGTGRGWQNTAMFWVATPYLPGLLLAAYLLYAKWLFELDEPLA